MCARRWTSASACCKPFFFVVVSLPSPLVSPSFLSSPRTVVFWVWVCARVWLRLPCGCCGSWWGVMDSCCLPLLRTGAVPPPLSCFSARCAPRLPRAHDWQSVRGVPGTQLRSLPTKAPDGAPALGPRSAGRAGRGPAPGRAVWVDPPSGKGSTAVLCATGGPGGRRAGSRRRRRAAPPAAVTTPARTLVCARRLPVRHAVSKSTHASRWGCARGVAGARSRRAPRPAPRKQARHADPMLPPTSANAHLSGHDAPLPGGGGAVGRWARPANVPVISSLSVAPPLMPSARTPRTPAHAHALGR